MQNTKVKMQEVAAAMTPEALPGQVSVPVGWQMSKLVDRLQEELTSLTPGEKAQILQSVAMDIADVSPGIESTPGVCGGNACIMRTRIPVWLLEELRRQGASEAEILHSYPTLRAQDLVNAWAYVRKHREEIERQRRENEEA